MKICFITTEYNGKYGGGGLASYIYTTGVELIRKGHQVIVITKGIKRQTSKEEGIEVYRIPLGNIHYYLSKIPILRKFALPLRELEWSFSFAKKISEITRTKKIDMIESCETGNFFAMLFKPHIPWIIRTHGSTYSFKKHSDSGVGFGEKLDRLLQLHCMKKASGLSSPSQFQADEIRFETKGKKVEVIPNPVSQIFFEDPEVAFGNRTKRKVLYTGRLAEVKGILTLIEAASIVCKKIGNVEFVLAGPYHVSIPDKKLKALIKNKQLSGKVHLTGPIRWNKLGEYYMNCDIFVMPSFFESFCISVVEAMTCGKPVVATRAGALAEIVEHGVTGLLVEPGNPSQLADALYQLLTNEKLCMSMGAAGRKKALDHYRPEIIAEETVRFYNRIISHPWA